MQAHRISAHHLGIVLAAALLATGCNEDEGSANPAPEKAGATKAKAAEQGHPAQAAKDKTVAATESGPAAADGKKHAEGSCGAGSCGGKMGAKDGKVAKDAKDGKKQKEGSCGAGSCG